MAKNVLIVAVVSVFLLVPSASAQQTQSADSSVTGVVVSSSANTIIVKPENGPERLVVLGSDTRRPRAIPVGTTVRVVSRPDDEGIEIARSVTVTAAAPKPGDPATADQTIAPIPAEVRRLEREIERQARRYGAGFRIGMALDPELVTLGIQAKMGPVFNRNVTFRPSLDFGFGEVTTMASLNLDAVYRIPISSPHGRVSAYIGGGPGFNFLNQNFERAREGDRDIEFDNFDFDPTLNIVTGLDFRNGMFAELRSSAYGRPRIRFVLGFNF